MRNADKNNLKKLFARAAFFVLCASVLCSCMTAHRMDKLVTNHYTQKGRNLLVPPVNDYFDLDYSKVKHLNYFTESKYRAFFTVPLLFYTFSKEKIYCAINPKLVAYDFYMELQNTLSQEYYKSKLTDKHLTIQFLSLPNGVEHKYVSNYIALPSRYSASMGISINEISFTTDSGDVALKCFVRDKSGNTLKEISLNKRLNPVTIKTMFEGRRRDFIYNGMARFDERYLTIYRELINQILEEI